MARNFDLQSSLTGHLVTLRQFPAPSHPLPSPWSPSYLVCVYCYPFSVVPSPPTPAPDDLLSGLSASRITGSSPPVCAQCPLNPVNTPVGSPPSSAKSYCLAHPGSSPYPTTHLELKSSSWNHLELCIYPQGLASCSSSFLGPKPLPFHGMSNLIC